MCGIVGAISERNVAHILIEGLKRLEYRGYDSAGLAIVDNKQTLNRARTLGKVAELEKEYESAPFLGECGIAHTRWATHGVPSVANAHPHMSNDRVAVVHNGIIENYEELREQLRAKGYNFTSETDTEVIVHLIDSHIDSTDSLYDAVKKSVEELEGAYALGVIRKNNDGEIVTCRNGSPLVIGMGFEEHFIASDVHALLPVTQRFIFLEEDDIAVVTKQKVTIYDHSGKEVKRQEKLSELSGDAVGKGEYKHYMLKEIYEQPECIANTLEGRLGEEGILPGIFGSKCDSILAEVKNVTIIACGTSYHSASIAKYWIEKLAEIPCSVEIASEFRYRKIVVPEKALFVTISQSGETADTMAALNFAKEKGYFASLSICNVPESSLVRESDMALMTRAGPEIGVASTKAFTTQLVALYILTLSLAKHTQPDNKEIQKQGVADLKHLPALIANVLKLDEKIKKVSEDFIDKHHTLFLGRGTIYPVALEGALKLKEISYIHAEGYPAGELKHGPLALVDADMPVVAVAPNNELMDKLKSNLQEVAARGGQLYVFADKAFHYEAEDGIKIIEVPHCSNEMAPIVFTVPLQILSYHVAVMRGTDVDQPRNLAKSVTVE